MGESLVGFGHLMGVVTFLDSTAGVVERVHDLAGKAFLHGLLRAVSGIGGEPPEPQGLPPLGTDFHRDLVGGAADTAGLDFQDGHDVFECFGKSIEGILAGLFGYDVKRTVNYFLCNTLFSILHDIVDKTRYKL